MEAIIFSRDFEAPDELQECCKSLGYCCDHLAFLSRNRDLMFDERVVEFCKQRLSKLLNEKVYKGKESCKYRCGFSGAGYIRKVDNSRQWGIGYNNFDEPMIVYIDVVTN